MNEEIAETSETGLENEMADATTAGACETPSVRDHSQAVRHQMRKGASFLKALNVEVERALRYGRPLALVLIRAERAPRAHSTLWDTQRRVLVAELEERSILTLRTSDFFARVSESDFAICLPETSASDARIVAQKLREDPLIVALNRRLGQGVRSIDWRVLAHDPRHDTDAERFVGRAQRCFDVDDGALAATEIDQRAVS